MWESRWWRHRSRTTPISNHHCRLHYQPTNKQLDKIRRRGMEGRGMHCVTNRCAPLSREEGKGNLFVGSWAMSRCFQRGRLFLSFFFLSSFLTSHSAPLHNNKNNNNSNTNTESHIYRFQVSWRSLAWAQQLYMVRVCGFVSRSLGGLSTRRIDVN